MTPLIASLIRYIRAFGRGLAANKTLTQLNVSSNKLLPESIKVVCNALKTCVATDEMMATDDGH